MMIIYIFLGAFAVLLVIGLYLLLKKGIKSHDKFADELSKDLSGGLKRCLDNFLKRQSRASLGSERSFMEE